MDIGIFSQPGRVERLVEDARRTEADGFSCHWTSQVFSTDALTALAVAAREVDRIRFGVGVVPIQPRHPMALAGQALTVSQVSGGRLDLGIGLSHQIVVEAMWGLPFDRNVRRMREYLECLGPLLSGEDAHYGGELYTSRGALDVRADPPPVYVAALGEQMLKVAGRLADGTVTWMTGPKTIAEHTAPTLRAAAEAAGRPEPKIFCSLPMSVTDDVEGARARADEELSVYGTLPSYRAMLDREGASGPGAVAIVGTADQVAESVAGLEAAGVTTALAAIFGSPDEQAATREVLRGLR